MPDDAPSQPEPPDAAPEALAAPQAWQPLTPCGVAAFARAPLRRLWGIQFAVALLAAAVGVWFLLTAWCPVIRQAIRQLPDTGEIRQQQLVLARVPDKALAQSRHLAVVIDPAGQSAEGSGADLRVRFRNRGVELCSLFGCMALSYPRDYSIQFNAPELRPWWDAWQPFLLGSAALISVALLWLLWGGLALLYTPVVWALARFNHRVLTCGGAAKLAGAALMPGALLLTLGLVLYGTGTVDLIRLTVVFALHVALGWGYVVAAVLTLPGNFEPATTSGNPFAGADGTRGANHDA
jgi:hypothetical protein